MLEQHWHKLHGLDWRNKNSTIRYKVLSQRFTDDWFVIDGEDEALRDQCFAQYVLQTLQRVA